VHQVAQGAFGQIEISGLAVRLRLQLRGAQDTIAFYAAALASQSRGSPQAQTFDAAGDQAIRKILVRGTRRQQHSMHRRRPYAWRSQNVFL